MRAVEPGRVSFRMLHNKDYSPLKRKMFCPAEEKIVPSEEIIKGFEMEPGKHVLITNEELESVSPDRSRTIEIAEFIQTGEIDPIYYDHPYYLVPLKGGEKSYKLLAQIMRRTGRAGIAKFVLDEREYLVTVTSRDGALVVSTLHYSDEILPGKEFAPEKSSVAPEEKTGLKESIKKMMTNFTPGKYSDVRREKLMAILKKKTNKAAVLAPETESIGAEGVEDLVAALEKSMHDS
ncbi:MAG: Ku protein [Chitinivibrionales bacterium]|nr:Ku protein [Chitinivibrionales bacterium]